MIDPTTKATGRIGKFPLALLLCAALGAATPSAAQPGLSKRDVLSLSEGEFYLDGARFAEISFNKFDLLWALYGERTAGRELGADNPMVKAQENALLNLKKLGFRSIRVFAFPPGDNAAQYVRDQGRLEILFQSLDKMLELCGKHGIGVVWSLGGHQFTDQDEHLRELCANPRSKNRAILYAYLDQVVNRYRENRSVLMWEICNELTLMADIGDEQMVFDGKRMPTLKNVADFYNDVASFIKARDPLRLVSNGGSSPRSSQWNLYQRVGWRADTYDEQVRSLQLLFANSPVDVVDIHYYPDINPGVAIASSGEKERRIGLSDYKTMARSMGKTMIAGEIGPSSVPFEQTKFWEQNPGYFRSYSDTAAALPWVKRILDEIVEAGVPLSYWWAYQSDRPIDQPEVLSLERTPVLIAAIAEANERLKTKLGVKPFKVEGAR